MLRLPIAAALAPALLALLVACGGENERDVPLSPSNEAREASVTGAERPAGVPDSARAVVTTAELGQIERRANAPPNTTDTRELEDASCEDGTITLQTSQETIYAVLPCDRFWDAENEAFFVGEEVAIVFEVTDGSSRILIETIEGAQTQFPVDGVWVE